jgi:hypothetical protein
MIVSTVHLDSLIGVRPFEPNHWRPLTDTIVRAQRSGETSMPRTATIGPAVYKRVTELTAEGKNRTEAFQIVAQERQMNPGTVAANYYRTARGESGTTRRPKTRARKAATATTKSRPTQARRRTAQPTTDTDMTTLANQISDLVQQLVRQVEERDRRLREVLG